MAETETDEGRLRADLDALRTDLDKLTETLREVAEGQAEEGLRHLRERADRVRSQARDYGEQVEHQIEARPFTSVLAAFGVGMLLGALLGRN